jgi:hypothetical protein
MGLAVLAKETRAIAEMALQRQVAIKGLQAATLMES